MSDFADDGADSNSTTLLTADITERDGVVVVTIIGELDMASVHTAEPVVADAVSRGKPVVIDLSRLSFFSSAGLTVLARLDDRRRHEPLDVRLVADQRVVVLPLRLTGLQGLFPIHPTLDDAVAAIRQIGRPS